LILLKVTNTLEYQNAKENNTAGEKGGAVKRDATGKERLLTKKDDNGKVAATAVSSKKDRGRASTRCNRGSGPK
jgi:hypothetical protein